MRPSFRAARVQAHAVNRRCLCMRPQLNETQDRLADPARPQPAAPARRTTPTVDVSVLVPVLNEERHVNETLRAMQAQDYPGTIEFLFMDGRSADRTRELIAAAAGPDPRIRLLDNPLHTTPAGLNVGLRAARGEFIVRM